MAAETHSRGHRRIVAALCLLAALGAGCNTATGHRVLRLFFDGVPEPKAAPAAVAAASGAQPAAEPRRVGRVEHEPYAAKECEACHDAKRTNSLVLPPEKLCFQCHDFDLSRKYVHGPLAAGGCLLCHDPHTSPYRHLLKSESDGFCLSCHDRRDLSKVEGHESPRTDCTSCHEAHMSDKKYLLK